jgi:DNA-binding protein HU-beta
MAKNKPAAKKAKTATKPAAKKTVAKKTATKKAVTKKATTTAKKATATKKTATKKAAPVAKVVKAKPEPKRPLVVAPKKPVLLVPKNKTQYTQSELYDCLTGYCGFPSRKQAKEFYGQFSVMIQGALKNGYRLALPGLGKIQVRKTKPRTGINPKTREPIKIPAKKKVRFTANKALKDAVL